MRKSAGARRRVPRDDRHRVLRRDHRRLARGARYALGPVGVESEERPKAGDARLMLCYVMLCEEGFG